jgi:hypothetical protein
VIDVLRLTRKLIDIPSVTGEEFQIGTSLGEMLSDGAITSSCRTFRLNGQTSSRPTQAKRG